MYMEVKGYANKYIFFTSGLLKRILYHSPYGCSKSATVDKISICFLGRCARN